MSTATHRSAPAGAAPIARSAPPPMGASVGAATPNAGSLPLAAEHFAAATLFLAAGAVGLIVVAPEIAAGLYASPRVAGVTHLFTLGWLTTTIFGALYQLLPVALGAPLRWVRLGHASFWTYAPGVALFAAGLATGRTPLHHAGIALVATGIVLALANVAAALPRARSRDVTWAAVLAASVFLLSTFVLGVVLLHNLHTGFLADARLRVLSVHLHVAIVGWALVTIVGVSHRLLPMFLLAHGADTRWTRRALGALVAGVPMLASGIAARQVAIAWPGAVLLAAGVGCFAWQARAFHRARVRRRIDVGMKFAAAGIAFLLLAVPMGFALLALGPDHRRLATAYVLAGLLGGIVLYVVGHFYKIVPLLAWTARYRGLMGRAPVPTVADMFSARVAHVQLALMTFGVAAMSGGTLAAHEHCVRAGAVAFTAGVGLFVSQIARIALGRAASARGTGEPAA